MHPKLQSRRTNWSSITLNWSSSGNVADSDTEFSGKSSNSCPAEGPNLSEVIDRTLLMHVNLKKCNKALIIWLLALNNFNKLNHLIIFEILCLIQLWKICIFLLFSAVGVTSAVASCWRSWILSTIFVDRHRRAIALLVSRLD